jgi:hypothetical protein
MNKYALRFHSSREATVPWSKILRANLLRNVHNPSDLFVL